MNNSFFDEAHEIFCKYDGNFHQMNNDGVYDYYKSYMVPQEKEMQWLEELFYKLMDDMQCSSNNKVIAELFTECTHIVTTIKDEKIQILLFNYLLNHKGHFDSNTLVIIANSMIDLIKRSEVITTKTQMFNEILDLLDKSIKIPIWISSDYACDGILPDYLTKEKILDNMKNTVAFCENELRYTNA